MKNDLELIATKEFDYYNDMYKVVDFLNKNLSNLDIVFGLTEKNGKHILAIYKES
ncbi:hypothetical protein BD780_001826 [Clostridium tetanomorphum]|uniref:DUF4264 family protein n=1 Tax=Clostridium tetanomorphum TaxID=1553 RepID=A0A923EDX2_CLOTT|nr:DUF4264 family protein [Clostridium tetanomorphum]KAJ52509.1 hypothetical protein CTM_07466 [Clostridium tetanomorphum DSM 665]MBC2399811.1 DUF4264 family protein [Clostridium tetanomorphum]MBP1864188.1 hypothetical protein [Clostridium tetanomorphum]NRS84601.1 hypothetical protein [Clostridium tetanomorphum]NRZ97816.1 hypothetical protein [Clostridium tetanomorphum]